jgi:type IV secretion system protein VirB10
MTPTTNPVSSETIDAQPDANIGDIRPVVGRNVTNRGAYFYGIGLLIAAIALFAALEARRANNDDRLATKPVFGAGAAFAPPPELFIPSGEQPASGPGFDLQNLPQSPGAGNPGRMFSIPPPAQFPAQRSDPGGGQQDRASPPRAQNSADGSLFPATILRRPARELDPGPQQQIETDRKIANRITNPSNTLPKGAIIQAVLETALDSTRSGAARAIVSRDVSSFDGTRVVIPKGSKLIGEYAADLTRGQNRALIQWQRLVLPGGWIIDVDSPSADALGRAGIKGKVDTHFFARFSDAILQSVLDLGVQLAARKAGGNTVIIGLPGGGQTPISQPDDIKPTLRVRQGTSVTVFVADDLDFTGVPQ